METPVHLVKHAEQFLKNNYNLSLTIPIIINNRLRSTMGVFYHNKTKSLRIELSGKIIKYGHELAILDILNHELVHYALFEKGLPYKDGDSYFEEELSSLGVGSTESNFIGELHICKCETCNRNFTTDVKSHYIKSYYKTTCCNAKVVYVKTVICDGTEGDEKYFESA